MKARAVWLICLILIALGSQGSTTDEPLTVLADYASFYDPVGDRPYVEFYYGLYRNQLGFLADDSGAHRYAGVLVEVMVTDTGGNPVDSASTYFLSQAIDEADQNQAGIRLFGYLPLALPAGDYRAVVTVVDDVTKKSGQSGLKVRVPDYAKAGFAASDLELAHEIRDVDDENQTGVNSHLIKEGRLVVPNPSTIYQAKVDSIIPVYMELYGLLSGSPAGGDPAGETFSVEYQIKNPYGEVVKDFGIMRYEKPGNSVVLTHNLSIGMVPPGDYNLFMEASESASGHTALAIKPFVVYDPDQKQADIYEADADLMANIAYYHLGEAEKMQIDQLSPEGKRNFIKQFWRMQDNDPSDPANPVYDEAVRRFKYANDNFSSSPGSDDGWKSDRGRVYIMYGPYDEWEEEAMPGKSYPYVKWTYYDLDAGRVIFVFVNDFVAGAIDYRLVHSTQPREKYDPSWQAILQEGEHPEDDWRDGRDIDW